MKILFLLTFSFIGFIGAATPGGLRFDDFFPDEDEGSFLEDDKRPAVVAPPAADAAAVLPVLDGFVARDLKPIPRAERRATTSWHGAGAPQNRQKEKKDQLQKKWRLRNKNNPKEGKKT